MTCSAIVMLTPAAEAISSTEALPIPRVERNRLSKAIFFAGPIPGISSKTDSRIVRFQSKYKIIDFVDDPGDMLIWVFPKRFENIEDYPEDNTLRRLTKERMRRGGILGYGVGVRL